MSGSGVTVNEIGYSDAPTLPIPKPSTKRYLDAVTPPKPKGDAVSQGAASAETAVAGAMSDIQQNRKSTSALADQIKQSNAQFQKANPPPNYEAAMKMIDSHPEIKQGNLLKAMVNPVFLVALAATAAVSRGHILGAMQAAGAYMKGFQIGDQQRMDAARQKWLDDVQSAKDHIDLTNKQYQSAIEAHKYDVDALQTQMEILGNQNKDDVMLAGLAKDAATIPEEVLKTRASVSKDLAEAHSAAMLDMDKQNAALIRQEAAQKVKDGTLKSQDANEWMLNKSEEIKNGGGGGPAASPEERQSAAAQVAMGMPLNQVVPGYGKQAAAKREQARTDAIHQIIQQHPGMKPDEAGRYLANKTIEFLAGRSSVTQLTKMAGGTKQGIEQLDYNIDKATEEMKKLSSSNISPVLNAIARGQEKWTGDPAYSSLFFYLGGAAVEAARLRSGGQASAAQLHQGAAEEAEQWANINMTPKSWASVAAAMKNEGRYKLKTYQDAIDYQESGAPNFEPNPAWPAAPQQDGKVLKDSTGAVVAKSSGGQWISPNE